VTIHVAFQIFLFAVYTKDIRPRLEEIQSTVTDYWSREHANVRELLQKVPITELRAIAKTGDAGERTRYRILQCVYAALTIGIFVAGVVLNNVEVIWLLVTSSIAFVFFLVIVAWMFFADYYAFEYYKTLSELEKKALL
jgi:hypothetical protein